MLKKAVMRHAINAIWHGYVENPAAKYSLQGRATLSLWREAWARKLSSDKQQSTFIHELNILWWFHAWAVLRSLANTRKCQLEDFCEKERYDQSNGCSRQTPSARFGKEKTYRWWSYYEVPTSVLLLRNPRVLFQKHGGASTMYWR